MVDKDLFLYDLAVVAILKNEGPYLKEWLDYHLVAGVDHFYLYDNDSPDNQAEVAKPYVEAGLVTYIPFPGMRIQNHVYNDAVKQFKFQCRYMAFIDGDEFIFPKISKGGGIVEVVDEILSQDLNSLGLGIHWQVFGSNGQEKADYSRGVLERFTRRAKSDWCVSPPVTVNKGMLGNCHVKNIINPRKVNIIRNPHIMKYFTNGYNVNENATRNFSQIAASKIVINHYMIKSQEEYLNKIPRGDAFFGYNTRSKEKFELLDRNEVFDDGILAYRDARAKIYHPPKSRTNDELIKTLKRNLSPTLSPDTLPDFYAGKMETFLTCRAVAAYIQTKLADDTIAKFYEEVSLNAALKAFITSATDRELFIREWPALSHLPYCVYLQLEHIRELFKDATNFIEGQNNISMQELEHINRPTTVGKKILGE